ncbi:MAG: pyrroline-5-carboxylate reductase [Candidatus Omnitrophota bacterium]
MLGIIGVGRMGSAIVAGLLQKKVFSPEEIVICDQDFLRTKSLTTRFSVKSADLSELVALSDAVVLAVKPQDIESVVTPIKGHFPDKLLISILAGVSTSYFEDKLGEVPVVRVMPNLGIKVGAGMSFYAPGRFARPSDRELVSGIFGSLGEIAEIQEDKMDIITGLSGSGPAYFFLLMEILAGYAQKSGISEELSVKLAKQTARAAAFLVEEESPSSLRAAVTSKGGTTEAAIKILEEKQVREIFTQAFDSALKRARELSAVK